MDLHISRRHFLALTASASVALVGSRARLTAASAPTTDSSLEPLAPGPFQPNWGSLGRYRCPEWFRDAKLGLWAHWSAQCVPEQGDWYARNMYIQGTAQYDHHVRTYGHPSKFGFKEIDHLWRAENWDPEQLVEMYRRAGAKYFVALANHHDNFDNYDSKYHAWNSTRVGPRKDLIKGWADAARRNGLKFGVSNHSSHAWHWFQVAYGYDAEGPLAGVPYDGYATRGQGAGKWWDGLDPQELYTGQHLVIPPGMRDVKAMQDWHKAHDGHWYETPPPDDPDFAQNWLLRVKDLINKYHPDLLYFDDTGLPFGDIGLQVAAHLYNTSIRVNGENQAVLNAKKLQPEQRTALVEDYERGFSDVIQPDPWQTDTCIGAWHYKKDIKYKSVGQVVHRLIDIVSKNGNLLLNIPVRGDGTIDDREVDFVGGLTRWIDVNGEGIFASRPWRVHGEGPTKVAGGMFNEDKVKYTAADLRFTASKDGKTLYTFCLGTPVDEIRIASLGRNSTPVGKPVASVQMLGSTGKLAWSQETDALVIKVPANLPGSPATGFRIAFEN